MKFARPRGIPVVVDVRDLWPDIFLTALPGPLRHAGRPLLEPLFRQTRRVCRDASALTGVSQSYLDWGLANAGRAASSLDRVFPLGYGEANLDRQAQDEKTNWLVQQGVRPDRLICTFFGLFEKSYDLHTVVRAAKRLQSEGRDDIQFVLCGNGGKLDDLRRQSAGLRNVVLPGWVDKQTIAALMQMAKIGLAAYASDAMQSLPNKPFEYMAGRLAVVSGLSGELATLLDQHRCGVTYRSADAASLAAQVAKLADDPAELATMQDNAYEAYARHYRVETISEAICDHLESIRNLARPVKGQAA